MQHNKIPLKRNVVCGPNQVYSLELDSFCVYVTSGSRASFVIPAIQDIEDIHLLRGQSLQHDQIPLKCSVVCNPNQVGIFS